MHSLLVASFGLVPLLAVVRGFNFPYEAIQLTESDIDGFPAIDFGSFAMVKPRDRGPRCKAYPDSDDWPSNREWTQLNTSLSGALLRPVPAASACYNGSLYNPSRCSFLLTNASQTRFYSDDPLTVLTQWPQGNTCLAAANASGTCTQGGFAVYVVNATTVKDVQVAVNFARNKNVRLVIKNTGHDFLGRNTGAGAISVWTHYLKSFELIQNYKQGQYKGMAARVGAGLETWEAHNYMDRYGITLIVPLTNTVGPYGGFTAGGGHSTFSSYYGLGSDQVLSFEVVTADGRFVTADPNKNSDLFWALRGGGGSTYGIVTSAIVKAHPAINVTVAPISYNTGNASGNANETFWKSMNTYFKFATYIVDGGGIDRSYVSPQGSGFNFRTSVELPGKSSTEAAAFLKPVIDALRRDGITLAEPTLRTAPYGTPQSGNGARPGNSRFSSRLFPRANWEDDKLYNATMQAVRLTVEAGYTFHGLFIAPTKQIAGYPGRDSGANPAFRTTVMHADVFDFASPVGSTAAVKEAHDRLDHYTNLIRAVTPKSGAYTNEADVLEPNWQQSFWGTNYPRLLAVKKKWDPRGVFWAPASVGSEDWEVTAADGLATQNGRLCRAW